VIRQAVHKMFSVVLALLVLLSTLSFTIDKHFCGETLVDSAIFSKAKTCGMEMEDAQETGLKKSCCKEEVDIIKGQDELKLTSFDNLKFQQQVFITSFVYSYIYPIIELKENEITFDDYPPPLIVKTIYKLDEVYLI